MMDKYLHLDLYPDAQRGACGDEGPQARDPLQRQHRHAGRAGENSGLDRVLDATISIDSKKIFKPSPDAYTLIEEKLACRPHDVLFVSSNPWDACGAKSFGLNVAWIERVTPEAMAQACVESDLVAPLTMFKAIRTQMDELGSSRTIASMRFAELPDGSCQRS